MSASLIAWTEMNPRTLHRGAFGQSAFSLAEVLVALGVLSLIIVITGQLVNSSSLLASGSRKRLDSESQARLVLGRIGDDLSRMLSRDNVECLIANAPGNDALYFYSEAPAAFAYNVNTGEKSAVALVGYRIGGTSSANPYRLERLGKGLKWSGNTSGQSDATVFLSKDATGTVLPACRMANAWASILGTAPAYQNGTDSTYQLLSDGVIRLEVAFLKTDGTTTQDPDGNGDGITTNLSKVSALVITIAVLDEDSQKVIDKTKIAVIASALADPTSAELLSTPPLLMAKKWQNQLAAPSFASSLGVPASIISRVRVYQRIYPLDGR